MTIAHRFNAGMSDIHEIESRTGTKGTLRKLPLMTIAQRFNAGMSDIHKIESRTGTKGTPAN